MIIYIHGFGSHGYGSKAKVFRKYFKSIGEEFIAPSLSYVPALAIQTLEELIHSYHGDVYLIGSSLGGFYATYLSQLREVKKVVLINPAVTPDSTLKRAIGYAPNFYDESSYEWNEKHLKMLGDYKLEELNKDKFMVLLQKGDELLDYKDAQEKYHTCKLIVEEGGSHSFDGIERHLENIRAFFSVGDHFKHTSKVKGVGFELDELAKRVGDLYYDDMALFLEALAQKISQDTKADKQRGRAKLAYRLGKSASLIKQSAKEIEEAWQICKVPTIKWMVDNGFNKEMKSNFLTEIISHEFMNRSRCDTRSFSNHNTRHDIANYDDNFAQEVLAPFRNKVSAYKEYLKAYLSIFDDIDFYPENPPDDKEVFIKEKLKEFGFDDE